MAFRIWDLIASLNLHVLHQRGGYPVGPVYFREPDGVAHSLYRVLASNPIVRSITEFGVRFGMSTSSFMLGLADQRQLFGLHSQRKITGYDIRMFGDMDLYKQIAGSLGISFNFHVASSLESQIEDTDLLLLDTLHCYGQLRRELELHHSSVRHFIVLHDTMQFGKTALGDCDAIESQVLQLGWDKAEVTDGIEAAFHDFLAEHREWEEQVSVKHGTGTTVLKRVN